MGNLVDIYLYTRCFLGTFFNIALFELFCLLIKNFRYMKNRKTQAQGFPTVLPFEENIYRHVGPSDRLHDEDWLPFCGVGNRHLFVSDIQHLTLHTLFPQKFLLYPRWCRVFKARHVPTIVLLNLDQVDTKMLESENIKKNNLWFGIFEIMEPVMSSSQYGVTSEREFFKVPLSGFSSRARLALESGLSVDSNLSLERLMRTKKKRLAHSNGGGKAEKDVKKENNSSEADEPEKKKVKTDDSTQENVQDSVQNSCSRQHLLLNKQQMLEMKFPLPCQDDCADFVSSRDHYEPITNQSPMFSIDCEMVIVAGGGMSLARISIVNEKAEIVYNELVKPQEVIVNYVTRISGINASMLEPVSKTVNDVRNDLRRILPADAILVGHSLENDLRVMKIFHPYVIDTSVIYNITGDRQRKAKLQLLASKFLKRIIQSSVTGHCSIEDANAAMDLVLLKLQKGLAYGDRCAQMNLVKPEKAPTSVDGNDDKKVDNAQSIEMKAALQPECNVQEFMQSHAKFLSSLQAHNSMNLVDVLYHSQLRCKIIDSNVPQPQGSAKKTPGDWVSKFAFVVRPKKDKDAIGEVVSGTAGDNRFVYCRLRRSEEKIDKTTGTDKYAKRICSHIQKMYHALPPQAMFILLLKDCCFVRVKSPLSVAYGKTTPQPATNSCDTSNGKITVLPVATAEMDLQTCLS